MKKVMATTVTIYRLCVDGDMENTVHDDDAADVVSVVS